MKLLFAVNLQAAARLSKLQELVLSSCSGITLSAVRGFPALTFLDLSHCEALLPASAVRNPSVPLFLPPPLLLVSSDSSFTPAELLLHSPVTTPSLPLHSPFTPPSLLLDSSLTHPKPLLIFL